MLKNAPGGDSLILKRYGHKNTSLTGSIKDIWNILLKN